MNNARREKLRKLMASLERTKEEVECILKKEDEARDAMPENLQDSDRYTASEECSDAMSDAVSSLEEAIGYIEDAVQG